MDQILEILLSILELTLVLGVFVLMCVFAKVKANIYH